MVMMLLQPLPQPQPAVQAGNEEFEKILLGAVF